MRIKNWERFQHYKHRKPPWVKLYHDLLDDREWHALSGDASKMLANCWLLASEADGELPGIGDIAWRLRMDIAVVERLFSQLNHWVDVDASTMLAECKHVATPETETETETEGEDALRAPPGVEEKKGKQESSLPEGPFFSTKPPTRGAQLPAGWVPADQTVIAGLSYGWDRSEIDRMAEDMRLWAGSTGAVKKDWELTFMGWMRREKRSAPQQKGFRPQQVVSQPTFRPEKEIVRPPEEERAKQVERLIKQTAWNKRPPRIKRASEEEIKSWGG
jgi:hypothetical protein